MDRLSPFLGKPLVCNGIAIHSPTIGSIAEIGELQYAVHLILATFDKEKLFMNLLGYTYAKYEPYEEMDSYELITSDEQLAAQAATSISFFTKALFQYDPVTRAFTARPSPSSADAAVLSVNQANYKAFAAQLLRLNGLVHEQEKKNPRFKNAKAKKLYRELAQIRKKTANRDAGFELKDMLSLLCADEGNGITLFNVERLTVYQVYEQFERLGKKIERNTILPVWANGHLKEGEHLPDLFQKTRY